jgi:hypothetical protein
LAGVVVLILVLSAISGGGGKDNSNNNGNPAANKPKPTFTYLVPLDKAKAQGDKLKYDAKTKTVSIADSFGSAKIIMAQQSIDQKAASDPTLLNNVANSIATQFKISILERRVVKTSKGDFYYFSIGKEGQQRGVFSFNKLLIFLTSDKPLKDDAWKDYIDSLVGS